MRVSSVTKIYLVVIIVEPVRDGGVPRGEDLLRPLLTGDHVRGVREARRVAPLHLGDRSVSSSILHARDGIHRYEITIYNLSGRRCCARDRKR